MFENYFDYKYKTIITEYETIIYLTEYETIIYLTEYETIIYLTEYETIIYVTDKNNNKVNPNNPVVILRSRWSLH